MVDIILIVLLVGIAAGVIVYLIREKKRGAVCVGCPHAKQCAKAKSGGCSCGSGTGEK